MKLPEWTDLVKTNIAKELAPYDEDWFYTRFVVLSIVKVHNSLPDRQCFSMQKCLEIQEN